MAQGGVSRGVCAGVVGVTLRAEGGFARGVGAGRAEQQRGCVDALTEHMLMQTSGAVALTLLLTVLYWCVCVLCVGHMR